MRGEIFEQIHPPLRYRPFSLRHKVSRKGSFGRNRICSCRCWERTIVCQVRPACMERLGDLHKRATQKSYKRDLQKRPTKDNMCVKWAQRVWKDSETYTRELPKRGWKETLTKRSTKEMCKRDIHKDIYKRDLQKRPTKEKICVKWDQRVWKDLETYTRDLPKSPWKETFTKRSTKETYKREELCQMRPACIEACVERLRDLDKRDTKEVKKRPSNQDLQERRTKETYKRNWQKSPVERDLQKGP